MWSLWEEVSGCQSVIFILAVCFLPIWKQHFMASHLSGTISCHRFNFFSSLTSFKAHANSHDGVKPYKCPVCSVRMTRLENLRQHTKRLHKVDIRSAGPGSQEVVVSRSLES
jgi:hypothetical protein